MFTTTPSPPSTWAYVDARSQEDGQRGKKVSHATVRKEISTFATIWNRWAVPQGLVTGTAPTRGLIYRKGKSKPPFQTWDQIERQVARGGLTDAQVADFWDCLFVSLAEIGELLDFVKSHARHQFVHVMFAMASHLGCRRSKGPGE